jgi:DNA-binding CsgD family transcriptional regulator
MGCRSHAPSLGERSDDVEALTLPNELLGRRGELAAIGALLDDARNGGGDALLLRGDAGLGKTSLLEYAATARTDMRVIEVTGVESELVLPYAGLHSLCSSLLGGIDDLPPKQRAAITCAFGLSEGEEPQQLLVGLATLSLLTNASETSPTLCLIDDVQFLDPTSARLIAFVGRRLEATSTAMLVALLEMPGVRTPFDRFTTRSLSRLSVEDSGVLLSTVHGGALDSIVRGRIVEQADGNPLALIESNGGVLADDAGAVRTPHLPARSLLEEDDLRTLAGLAADARSMLILIATDSTGDPELLARALAALDIAASTIDEPEVAALLHVGHHVRFRHPSVRSAVYGAATKEQLREAHRVLADATDGVTDPERYGWHRAAASPGPDETVAAELARSAERASRLGGSVTAAVLWERAADLSPDGRRGSERLLSAAQVALDSGSIDRAAVYLAKARARPLTELGRAESRRIDALLALARGHDGGSIDSLLEAAKAFEPLDLRRSRETHLEALEAAMLAGHLSGTDGVRKAARSARSVLEHGSVAPTATDRLLEGLAAMVIDGYADGAPVLLRALGDLARGNDRWSTDLPNVCAMALWDDESLGLLARRRVELIRMGPSMTLPSAIGQLGEYEVLIGRLRAADDRFDQARAAASAIGSNDAQGRADLGPAIAAAWRGLDTQATTMIEMVEREAHDLGLGMLVSSARHASAILHIGHGRYEAGLAAAVGAALDPFVATNALPELIEASVRVDDRDLAVDATERLAVSASAGGTEWGLGMLARGRALISNRKAADDLYREAISRLGRCRVVPQLSRTRLLYGEWLRRERRMKDARRELGLARDAFLMMGAEAFAERAAGELRAAGGHQRHRTTDALDELTPQEARIAELVSEGSTNPEIAEHLFISRRTVEYHLSHVFAKVGVTSRTQLARVLLER